MDIIKPIIQRQWVLMLMDAALALLALILAYSMRLSTWYTPSPDQWLVFLSAPVITILMLLAFGAYRYDVRSSGHDFMLTLVKANTLSVLLWSTSVLMMGAPGVFPRSVVGIYWLALMSLVGGSRFAFRTYKLLKRDHRVKVLIYGAGATGMTLVTALKYSDTHHPLAFVDDDLTKEGRWVSGLRVYPASSLSELTFKHNITEIILAIPTASTKQRASIINLCEDLQLRVRICPDMNQWTNGQFSQHELKELELEDLLDCQPFEIDQRLLAADTEQKSILITGAGGSIGSELLRQIVSIRPKRVVLLEHSENALYQIVETVRQKWLNCSDEIELVPILGSILERAQVKHIISHHQIDTLYHAAAYKHVGLVETNVIAGVKNNILGTYILAEAAAEGGVESFVHISSDKAVNPTNVMGASKRVAELIVQSMQLNVDRIPKSKARRTRFSIVRFGNVLGSSGSVIPKFSDQIRQGGPVTVTHRDVRRYFMSISEATLLVIQAGAMSKGGEIFYLNMGDLIKVDDLAKRLIRLMGYSVKDKANPNGDIAIEYIGLSAGEKMYEELTYNSDHLVHTPLSRVMLANERRVEWIAFRSWLRQLQAALIRHNVEDVQKMVWEILESTQMDDNQPKLKSPQTKNVLRKAVQPNNVLSK